jgi:hypothetical protein
LRGAGDEGKAGILHVGTLTMLSLFFLGLKLPCASR